VYGPQSLDSMQKLIPELKTLVTATTTATSTKTK